MESITELPPIEEKNWLHTSFKLVVGTTLACFFLFPFLLFDIIRIADLDETQRIIIAIIPQIAMLFIVIVIALIPHEDNIAPFAKLQLNFKKWKNIIILQLIGFEILILFTISRVQLLIDQICKVLDYNLDRPPIEQMITESTTTSFIIMAVSAIIIAPIVEEIFYRLIIFEYIKKLTGEVAAIIITSLAFAAIHMNILQFASLFLLGVSFQMLYLKKKSILPSILLHSLNNAFAITVLFIIKTLKTQL